MTGSEHRPEPPAEPAAPEGRGERPRIGSENVRAYVERMASGEPAPGGGAAGALQAALGAALVGMSARYTHGDERAADAERAAARAAAGGPAARGLADADAAAFRELSAAYALPADDEAQRAERSRAVQEATAGAAQPPRELIAVAAEVLELARDLAQWCNPNVLSDLAAAAEAARAAAATGLVTLEINLRSLRDGTEREALAEAVGLGERTVAAAAELAGGIRERVRS
ncbi:cyclodeaminase/cyclohydrolase family protein [Kocuria flava]|uniref:cyclodeaminase/cyclohydrolase family protein n=1 Tax=Kocuria flava TaxID=446860 RepID=UPI001FF28268|nr:cyclodeaminase/cyclohydrolase family protein [Kocuria flava]MCJ8504953.1 cyclodeaminase/cyclohydrolase family protein [Kocuria flava]